MASALDRAPPYDAELPVKLELITVPPYAPPPELAEPPMKLQLIILQFFPVIYTAPPF